MPILRDLSWSKESNLREATCLRIDVIFDLGFYKAISPLTPGGFFRKIVASAKSHRTNEVKPKSLQTKVTKKEHFNRRKLIV